MPHSIDAEQQNDDKFTTNAHENGSPSKGDADTGVMATANCLQSNHINLNNVDYQGSGSSSSGSVSSSNSAGASDDDEDAGDCSLDSYQSDKDVNNLSPNSNRCLPAIQPDGANVTNGIEVKACRSIVDDELQKRLLIAKDQNESNGETSSERNTDSDIGGRLRFYLDGRCVLELRHDSNNEGRTKQWVQSFGKTYRPPIFTLPNTPPTPAWQPQESSNHEIVEDVIDNTPSSTVSSNKKKPYSNFYLTFYVKNRRRASHESNVLPYCMLRKVARRPSEILSKDLTCKHDVCLKQCAVKKFVSTMPQRSQRLNLFVDKLIQLNERENSRRAIVSNGTSNSILEETVQKKNTSTASEVQYPIKTQNLSTSHYQECDTKNEISRFLPERYYDPSKVVIPVDKTIGNPRSSLISKSIKNKRNYKDMENPSSEMTSKHAKTDCNVLDGELKSQALSSHCQVPQCKSPLLKLSDVGASKSDKNVSSALVSLPIKSNDGSQRKKKKGGGYGRGRTIGEAVRTYVINEILNLGGDIRTNYVPRGVFTDVASRYKIDATTTYRWWLKYCNGIRMAASGISNQPDTSHKGLLISRVAAMPLLVSDIKTKHDDISKDVSPSNSQLLEYSSLRRDYSSLMSTGASLPHGGRYSPRSDDSASSGASLADPVSLYVSSFNIAPHTGVWPINVPHPSLSNGQSSFQTGRMPLPLNVCVPYMWNNSSDQSCLSGISDKQVCLESQLCSDINSDEPLDLTVPKKELNESCKVNSAKVENRSKVLNAGFGTYSECHSDQFILRTLLSSQELPTTGSNNLVDKEARYSIGKPLSKSLAQRNMKPKHYPFVSLQIGSFEIHSNLDSTQTCERDQLKEIPNKFKVIFTQRKFVYEFETNAKMHKSVDENDQKESYPAEKRMACIVVPFNIVEAFWCNDATIVLRVVSKPFMFLGRKLKQVGCVPSLTVYETKKSVDLTGGQLSMAHLHKVTLIKPQLIEQLKIYLVLFDIRFRNLISPIAHSLVLTENKPVDCPENRS